MTKVAIITMELRYEQDIVLCRQRVRRVAELLSFDRQEQVRLATAVSEIARNAFEYAGGGKVELGVTQQTPPMFLVTVQDSGPGIPNLKSILDGRYTSKTGMGLGILGAKRLMEHFEVVSTPGAGTKIILGKRIPLAAPPVTSSVIKRVTDALAAEGPQNPLQEVQQQNQELLRALDELRFKQAELAELNRELEETNRGVVALYAELDEKAASLKRASETKSSFLSNMTHEFRTPLNSILGLSRAALSGEDGELTPEHKKQVTFIRKSAEALSELVNDLLDIAKVEAGKIQVRQEKFDVREVLGGLRGVLKPLAHAKPSISLVIEDPRSAMILDTDEGKVAQILRNLVSNALKYTERGKVRVTAAAGTDGMVRFDVSDTGIGIAPENQDRIFDEFIQIESPLQKSLKGTGLGLSLSRKLASLLGGTLTVRSQLDQGSVFSLVLPVRYVPPVEQAALPVTAPTARPMQVTHDGREPKVLIIDDEEIARYLLRDMIPKSGVTVLEAADGFEGIKLASKEQPDLIFLDLQMPAMSGFYVLDLLKSNSATRDLPIVVNTAMTLTAEERKRLARDTIAVISKDSPTRESARERIKEVLMLARIIPAPASKEEKVG